MMNAIPRLMLPLLLASLAALGAAQTRRAVPAPKPAPPKASPLASGQIAAVAFSPNGKTLAAGGYRVVSLHDAATGRRIRQFPGHAGAVTSLAFSPDGKTLAAGGGEPGKRGEIRLWEVGSGRLLRALTGHADAIYSLAFRRDGKQIASASYDQSVRLWNPNVPQSPQELRDHTDAVYAVAYSPDGKRLASAAGDRTVKVWDSASGRRLFTLSDSTAELYTLAFSPDGKRLAAGGVDRTLRLWTLSATDGKLERSAFAHDAPILRLAFSRDGKTILTAGEDNAVKRWDAATLAERKVYPKQPDWPQSLAVSPDDRLLAVGRYDGSLALYDAESGRLLREPLQGAPVENRAVSALPRAKKQAAARPGNAETSQPKEVKRGGPTLFPATLSGIAPTGAMRGQTVRFTLSGARIADATGVFFDDPAIAGKIATPPDSNAGILKVDVALGPTARPGVHRVFVQAPRGVTGAVAFAVGGWPEIAQKEDNDTPEKAQPISLPATVTGNLEKAGDADCYRFPAQAGEELVFEVIAQPLRSRLQPVLILLDAEGKTLAESAVRPGRADALLGHRFEKAGEYVLKLRDFENASGGDVHYRLNLGRFAVVTRAFPPGIQAGQAANIQVEGFNLGQSVARVQAPAETAPGQTMEIPASAFPNATGIAWLTGVRLAVGDDPEATQSPGNTTLEQAQRVTAPVTLNGKLTAGPSQHLIPNTQHLTPNTQHPTPNSHYFRFAAKKGQQLLLEVTARRLGSPLDSMLEVLDAEGRPIERAVLRAVAQTEITLNDRDSFSGGMRLVAWNEFRANDYLMVGREVVRIQALPRGPDEDVSFRTLRGQRRGYFGTTPEFHSVAEAVYKVEVHPPGSVFSPNGYPLTRLAFKNDDGSPLTGKDSLLAFTAPADGDYIARLTDARGQQGEDFIYRLAIRPARPDFRISMNPAHPNIPQGGAVTVNIGCERFDGFEGAIAVRMEGLPPGFAATETVIEAGESSAILLLSAAPDAVTPALPQPSPIRVVARAQIGGREVARAIEPENGARLLAVLTQPDVTVTTDRREIVLHPGGETAIEATIIRRNNFGGRVPIDVRNLPYGVRVLDIGLNGVLITEEDTARKFVLYCEPWVQPQTRAFAVIASVEGGIANGAAPLLLKIETPRATGAKTVGAAAKQGRKQAGVPSSRN